MKFSDFKVKEEAAGVGIITKQNATKDVPVGGEYMNVKKLGLGKGKPKKHPKKVRGSKTNVLFNLGMAESKRLDELLPAVPAAVATAARVATSVLPKIAKNPSHLGATGAGTAVGDKILKQITKSRDANKGVGLKGRNLRAKQLSQKNATNEVTAQDLSKDSEVYVDMDGVLADFFGAWKKLVGTDWREIKDLDSALQKIRDKDDFWLNIPVTSNAMNLLSLIKELKGKYNILSAPLPNDPNAEPHKREWVKKNLSAFPPSKVIITSNKSVHATQPDGTPNILIDDFGKNIAKWEAAGGVGFKHKDHKFERTVKNLKAYMNKPVEEAPEDEIKKIKQTAGAIQKAQSMMKPRYSSEIAALVEEEFEAIREAALRRYKKAKGKIDLYTAYTMAIEDEFPEIPNPIFVFQYMTDPVDPKHQDLVPQEAEDGSWADRADKDYQQKAKSKPKGTGFDPLIKGRWFAIKRDRDSYMDQGMEPEDALEKAAERHGVDPEEVEKWIAAGNAVKIKEAKMSKSSIKSIHKTADKIKDKPKAKKSIGNWAKERGMDPEGAIYAIATNMKKRKQGKKITGLGKESYTRDELPQIRKQHLDYIPHTMETVKVKDVVPVQKERLKENHKKQLYNILDGRFNPIVVDCYNRIVNGHHRYDILKMLKMESTTVAKLPFTLEFLLEIDRRGFLKGLGATAAMAMLPKAAKALSNDKEQWYVINEKGRLQGPMDRSKAKSVSIAYPKKLPAIQPAPEGFEIIIAQGSSKNLNMAFTKAQFAIKKIYAKRFPGKTVNVNRKIIKLQGRAIEAAGSSYVATQSAYVKKTTEESVEEGNLLANPQRSVLVKKKNGYDWYKIGTNMANITQQGIDSAVKKDKPDIMIQFYGGEKEKKYMMKNLKRMGYDVQDADGYNDTHFDEEIENSYRLRISLENFADGKKKGKSRPGRVKRSGASCKGSVTSLRAKAKKASGERAKMYHWCANMKGGKKKSESYTKQEFLKVLSESTTQQLDEGIKDLLTKLPKNLLSKVTPVIKKIPKTAKNLTLMAVLLGTMVNAVAAGDMAKVNTPLDKLNNMTTMSSTMDTGTADVGPGHTMPDNIKVLKMPTPPEAPNSNTPDGTSDNGTSIKTTKDGNRTVSSGAGTYTFSPDGKLLKYDTPKIKGYSQTHDLVKKTVTVNANTPVTMTKDFGNLSQADRDTLKKNDPNFDKSTTYVDQKATYDMSGKLISKDHTGVKSGAVEIGIGGDGNKSFKFDAGGGKVYKANTSDMPAAKKTLSKMQTDLNKAKDKSAPFQNKTT